MLCAPIDETEIDDANTRTMSSCTSSQTSSIIQVCIPTHTSTYATSSRFALPNVVMNNEANEYNMNKINSNEYNN